MLSLRTETETRRAHKNIRIANNRVTGAKALLDARQAARAKKEWATADAIRDGIAARGQNVMLAVQDDLGNVCKTQGAPAQDAVSRELTQEELTARLQKTGGTPYLCRTVRCVLERGLSVSAAELNRLRRNGLNADGAVGKATWEKLFPAS